MNYRIFPGKKTIKLVADRLPKDKGKPTSLEVKLKTRKHTGDVFFRVEAEVRDEFGFGIKRGKTVNTLSLFSMLKDLLGNVHRTEFALNLLYGK